MIVLALDGALGAFSAAIVDGERIIASRCEEGAVALERGLTMVAGVLEESRLKPARIERLAVGVGPGGFTGLRIAVAYAKSLAGVWRRPLVAIDSFDLLEYGSECDCGLAVVVGRPGVISARYRSGGGVRRASGRIDEVLDLLGLPQPAGSRGTSPPALEVVGAPKDVLDALAERGINVRSFDVRVTPAAAAAAFAAQSRALPASLHEVRADYGELPAAKPPRF